MAGNTFQTRTPSVTRNRTHVHTESPTSTEKMPDPPSCAASCAWSAAGSARAPTASRVDRSEVT